MFNFRSPILIVSNPAVKDINHTHLCDENLTTLKLNRLLKEYKIGDDVSYSGNIIDVIEFQNGFGFGRIKVRIQSETKQFIDTCPIFVIKSVQVKRVEKLSIGDLFKSKDKLIFVCYKETLFGRDIVF